VEDRGCHRARRLALRSVRFRGDPQRLSYVQSCQYRLLTWLDRALRLLIVTLDMHRVHHSVLHEEHDRTYGFNPSLWDRLFGTYRAEPEAGQQGMTLGLPPYQSEAPTRFAWSLWLSFGSQQARTD